MTADKERTADFNSIFITLPSRNTLGNRISAPLQARANRSPIGIGTRPPFRGALIDLLLRLASLLLGIGIGRGTDDRAGRAAQNQAGAGIARSADDGTYD